MDEYVTGLPKGDLTTWWAEMKDGNLPDAKKNIGWIKIAFIYAADYLNSERSFEQSMKDILLLGGDTDTNAAIVGGIIGASEGFSNLPQDWIEAVMKSES